MKTPMQEHIEWMQEKLRILVEYKDLSAGAEVDECIQHAEAMLEKERRAIVSAFAWGNITKVQYKSQHIAGEDYYNDRYNETF